MPWHFVLISAPALGPASWMPIAAELREQGHTVSVPTLAGFEQGEPPYLPRLLQIVTNQVKPQTDEPLVLVGHSGAGVLLPYIVNVLSATGAIVIFADAALPAESGPGAVTDSGFLPFLRDIAKDGILPPWLQWWSAEDLSPLFPDDDARRAVEAEVPALPLAFFEERLPEVPDSWRSLGKGYLRFSEPYEDLAEEARSRGWPVRELPGEHLHMMVRPRKVAAKLTDLAAVLALPC